MCGKFAAVSHGIWQTGPWNFEKIAAEIAVPMHLTYKMYCHSIRDGKGMGTGQIWMNSRNIDHLNDNQVSVILN